MFNVMPVNSVFHGVSWFHVAGQCIPIAPCVCYLERSIIPVTTKSNQTKRKEKQKMGNRLPSADPRVLR